MIDTEKTSALDRLYNENGAESLIAAFKEIAATKLTEAVKLLNDENLSFTCLFLLIPEIISFKLANRLNLRNITALRICAQSKRYKNLLAQLPEPRQDITKSVLKWMFITGVKADGISNEYDAMLDKAFAMLMINYHDRSLLKNAADLIFSRNRRGEYIHDIVWAYFKIKDFEALKLIAEYLLSKDERDVELASELLHYTPNKDDFISSPESCYKEYIGWLDDNSPFLYFTDESFNYSSSPEPCNMDEQARYINKEVSNFTKQFTHPLSSFEAQKINSFIKLDKNERRMLSDFSHKMYKNDFSKWSNWIKKPISKQLEDAKNALEVRNDYY